MTDPRPRLHRALDQIGALVERTAPQALDTPTPCDGWDVRTLLDHLVGVHRRIAGAPRGAALAVESVASDVADGEHAAVLAGLRDEITPAWADDAVLERETDVPWGRMPGRFVALGFTQEMTVHAWDLAVVTGRAGDLDPDLAEGCVEDARRLLPAEQRHHLTAFGPVVDVAPDAGPYERLVGWLGRDPAAYARA